MWIDMRRVVFSQGNAGSRCVREGKGAGIEGKDSKCVLGCAVDMVLHAMSCHALQGRGCTAGKRRERRCDHRYASDPSSNYVAKNNKFKKVNETSVASATA